MKYVSGGGPKILLSTTDVSRWNTEVGGHLDSCGLFTLPCSVYVYCGIIRPWDKPFLVFGDAPDDIYWTDEDEYPLFFRWVAADSLKQLYDFVRAKLCEDIWDEAIDFEVVERDLTLMSALEVEGDTSPPIQLQMQPGRYRIQSRYAESSGVMTVIHHPKLIG